MLTIENLTITHLKDLSVLIENLSFSLRDGERMALIGEEGNGKSTLLRAIAGDQGIGRYAAVTGRITLTSRAAYLPQELPEEARRQKYDDAAFFHSLHVAGPKRRAP